MESVGEGVDEVTEGDTVIPIFLPDCGECADCKSKKSNLCSKLPFKVSPFMPRHDQTTRFIDLNGHPIYHFLSVSSFSEYTVVDIAHLTKVDPTIPPNRACLLSCGISTGKVLLFFYFSFLFLISMFISFGNTFLPYTEILGVGAAWRSADVEAGSTVAIFGLGSIGLAV